MEYKAIVCPRCRRETDPEDFGEHDGQLMCRICKNEAIEKEELGLVTCPRCQEDTDPNEMVKYGGETMCTYCLEGVQEKEEADEYWRKEELKFTEGEADNDC